MTTPTLFNESDLSESDRDGMQEIETGGETTEKEQQSTSKPTSDSSKSGKKKTQVKSTSKEVTEESKHRRIVYIQNDNLRRQTAERRGGTLRKLSQEYSVMTGAKIYLKIHFETAKGKVMEWRYGQNFTMSEKNRSPREEGPLEKIGEAVKTTIQPLVDLFGKGQAGLKEKSPTPGGSEASRSLPSLFSPEKRVVKRGKSTDLQKCVICLKENVLFGGRLYETGWIGCSFPNCPAWTHTNCLGFPGLIEDEGIQLLPDHYCNLHIQHGRAACNVPSSYEVAEMEVDPPAPAQQGKRGKKGRGK